MTTDALSATHSIQQPVKTESEVESAFDEIAYLKGQSFLRMLESYLGEEDFRAGIRSYIQAHKFSNSTTADLWNALAGSSKKPVGAIAASWTEQPGLPLICSNGEFQSPTVVYPAQQIPLGYSSSNRNLRRCRIFSHLRM